MSDALFRGLLGAARREDRRRNPLLSDRERLHAFRERPGDFARDVLQTSLWAKQIEVIESALKARRIAVCSGQKIGKTTLLAALALWLYCQGWRVFATTPTEAQLNGAFWREVRRLMARATIKIPGEMHLSARGGLHDHETLSHIVGLLGRDVEALQGMSGANMAFIVDEASGVNDQLIEAIKGNLVGGGLFVMTGNPTRNAGEFYAAFTTRREHYRTFEISSLDVPQGAAAIPGLATRAECEAFRKEYGEDSPFYQVRVLGKFVVGQEGRVMPLSLIEAARAAWNANDVCDDAALVIGCDPAGPGGDGDESVFAPRRGPRIIELVTGRGLSEAAHVLMFEQLIERWGRLGDKLVIVLDREGAIGHGLYHACRKHFEARVHVIGFQGHLPAVRQPMIYKSRRDELHAALSDKARKGELELPPDVKLDQELNAPQLTQTIGGKFKVTDKKDLRKLLGRSPDRADAVMLASWWIPMLRDDASERRQQTSADVWRGAIEGGNIYDNPFDPYV